MIERVLVGIDDSEVAQRALRHALETYPDAEITVLHVVGGPSPMMGIATELALSDDVEDVAEEHAESVLDDVRVIAQEYDADVDTEVAMGNPARAIVNRAENYDMVVVGSHGGTLADRLFVGDVAEKVFRQSPAPVTVLR